MSLVVQPQNRVKFRDTELTVIKKKFSSYLYLSNNINGDLVYNAL